MKLDTSASLPRNWAFADLGQIADVQLGKMLDRKRTQGTPLRYLRNVNVRWGKIDTSDLLEMPFKNEELERYSLAPGDILVCEGGEPGRAAVWQKEDPTIKYQKALHRVRTSGLLPHWLVFHLYFDAQRGALARHFTGTTIKHFPREAVRDYTVRVAPIAEQHRIVEAIESYFTRLDDAVATLERVQRNLKRYRASVLKAAVEGRLVPTEAELARAEGRDYEPASVLLERILAERRRRWEEAELAKMKAKGKVPKNEKWKEKYREPAQPETPALPELPEGWCWARSEQVCDFITKGTTPKADLMSQGVGDIPYIKVYNLTFDGSLDFTTNPTFVSSETHRQFLRRSVVRPGDVLANIVGPPLGKVSVVPSTHAEWNINQAIARFTPLSGLSPSYLALVLGSSSFLEWAKRRSKATAGQYNLTLEICRDTPIPLPPGDEQFRIVEEAARATTLASETESDRKRSAIRCSRLKQSILKWAFEGRLVDQDPRDEPAGDLLERITSEREAGAANSKPKRTRRRSKKVAAK